MVNLNEGLAGEGAEVRIRGTLSISQSHPPTIYVDGVRMDNSTNAGGMSWNGGVPGRMSEINPDAIERIEILKGATASVLYGSKVSNGIIKIITNQGAIIVLGLIMLLALKINVELGSGEQSPVGGIGPPSIIG